MSYSTTEKEANVRNMLAMIGENPDRTGLLGTPERIVRMWNEIFRGYNPELRPKVTTFPNGQDGIRYNEMVSDSGTFYSMCEHHMMPFFGKYWFAYIPAADGQILGLSKVARIVDYHSAKLQIQERLGMDIVNHLLQALTADGSPEPLGIAICMEGEHLCKTMRGVKKTGSMRTTYLSGAFEREEVRQEFLALVNGRGQ